MSTRFYEDDKTMNSALTLESDNEKSELVPVRPAFYKRCGAVSAKHGYNINN